ncbi:glycosyltransferase family 4 protein [Noviherbaspirillum agri]
MAKAALVVAGNNYLAQRARDAGAICVEVVPTVIDLNRYPSSIKASDIGEPPRIVWIGSPSTAQYLELLREPLNSLSGRLPFIFRVVGASAPDLGNVQVEEVSWTESSEVASIHACDVGVMPLVDSFWERGKCGYKLIQYAACGLPVVASNVGANSEIVQQGKNGYLAETPTDWSEALGALLLDKSLRSRLGSTGRAMVEQTYSIQQTGARMAKLLRLIAASYR